jgi:hypothetical protein
MTNTDQARRIKALADSLSTDLVERERLKKLADMSLAGLHDAVREFVGRRDARDCARRDRRAPVE